MPMVFVKKRENCIRWLLLWLLINGLVLPNVIFASAMSQSPIIRVETGAHSAPIFWTALFPGEEHIATVSLDKTLRIWRTRDLKPIQTFRIPIEIEQEGKLHFVTVSPNGKLVAVGGWTCWNWEQKGCVYLFDVEQGQLVKRIGGLPNIIGNIRFSPDGQTLAVGMHGSGGVAFIDLKTFATRNNDRDYAERVTGFDYSPEGYLIAGAWDGYVRAYQPDGQLAARLKLNASKRIGAIFYSPDRHKVLIGAYDKPRLKVFSFPDFNELAEYSTDDLPGQQSLRFPVWSHSGQYIYAIGDSVDKSHALIFKWHSGNLASRQVIKIPTHRVQSIHPLANDRLLFSTEDGSLGILDNQGKIQMTEPSVTFFLQHTSDFQVSEDGKVIKIPASQTSGQSTYFNTDNVNSDPFEQSPDSIIPMSSARTESKRLQLSDWKNSATPRLNGKRLKLDPFEETRSFAYSPDKENIVLGTEWALRCYNARGKLQWGTAIPGVIWNVNVTRNGHFTIATLSDGTVRWYRMTDGKEVLALFMHINQQGDKDWVLWQPDGYYASSAFGDNFIGWHINRGMDQEPDFYRAVQFERIFYRPDILKNVINTQSRQLKTADGNNNAFNSVGNTYLKKAQDSLSLTKNLSIHDIAKIAPPRIKVMPNQVNNNGSTAKYITVAIQAEKNSLPMKDMSVYVNSIPITSGNQRDIKVNEQGGFIRNITLPVQSGDNLLRVEINNGTSMGLLEHFLEIPGEPDQDEDVKGDLYLVAVGVNQFDRAQTKLVNLRFAANDAVALADSFEKNADISFKHTNITVLSDESELKPTRQNILQAMQIFNNAKANDTVVLFLDSHGFSDARGNFYFVPADGNQIDIHDIEWKHNLSGSSPSLIGWDEIANAFRKAAGRRILLIDTCQAGGRSAEPSFNSGALIKRSAASHFPLLLASEGEENSWEYDKGGHGRFTYTVLDGLKGPADSNQDQIVTVNEIYRHIVALINTLGDPEKKQTPRLIAPKELQNIKLIRLAS